MRKKKLSVNRTLDVILEKETIYRKILEDIRRIWEYYLISIDINLK